MRFNCWLGWGMAIRAGPTSSNGSDFMAIDLSCQFALRLAGEKRCACGCIPRDASTGHVTTR